LSVISFSLTPYISLTLINSLPLTHSILQTILTHLLSFTLLTNWVPLTLLFLLTHSHCSHSLSTCYPLATTHSSHSVGTPLTHSHSSPSLPTSQLFTTSHSLIRTLLTQLLPVTHSLPLFTHLIPLTHLLLFSNFHSSHSNTAFNSLSLFSLTLALLIHSHSLPVIHQLPLTLTLLTQSLPPSLTLLTHFLPLT